MWQRFKGFFSWEDEPDKTRPQRARPKPRQDWLVAVGQGHSPARTLRRESRGPGSKPRRKKFDTARLSFGGLEQEEPRRPQSPLPADDGTDARQPCSPPTTPSPRLRRNRPDFSPSSTASSRASSRRHPATATSPRSPGGGDGSPGCGRRGSPSRRSPAQAPASPREDVKVDWLSAAKSGNRSSSSSGGEGDADALAAAAESGGTNDDGNAGSSAADAKLNSLLVLSPGKEYWAGRLAAKGPRESSESPQAATVRKKTTPAGGDSKSRAHASVGTETALPSPREVSPLKYPARKERNMALRYAGRHRQHDGPRGNGGSTAGSLASSKEFASFRAGRKGAPVSPGGSGGGTSSAWSAQASATDSSPDGRRRADPSPWRTLQKGEVWSPSSRQVSPSTVSWSPAKGQRRRDFSPASARLAREHAPASSAAAAAAGPAYQPAAKQKGGGAASLNLSPVGFRGASPAKLSPRRESVGPGFVGGGRSASPLQRQASRDPLASRAGPQVGGYTGNGATRGRPLARERVASPSSLPTGGLFKNFGRSRGSGGSGSLRDSGSPERTRKDPDESEEGPGKSKESRRKAAAAAAAGEKKEEATALALPPATEKHFIGFLPEEFCAPFRLLFQLFAKKERGLAAETSEDGGQRGIHQGQAAKQRVADPREGEAQAPAGLAGGGGAGAQPSEDADAGEQGSAQQQDPPREEVRFRKAVVWRARAETTSPTTTSAANAVAGGSHRTTDWLSAAVARGAGKAGRGFNGSLRSSSSSHAGGAGDGAVDAQRTVGDSHGAEDCGGDATGPTAEGDDERDAKLSSLLLLSPGKEYWAGRLADQGRRDSESPRAPAAAAAATTAAGPGRNKHRLTVSTALVGEDEEARNSPTLTRPGEAAGVASSPVRRKTAPDSNTAPSPTWRRDHQQQQHREEASAAPGSGWSAGKKKDYLSFTAGKRGAPLSPGGSIAGSSVWSTQALTSPGGGVTSLGGGVGGGKGRVDLSPWRSLRKGEAWSPSSPSSSSLSPARGQRRRGFSPAGTLGGGGSSGARFGSAAAIAASLQAAKRDSGASSASLSPAGGGGSPGFRTASSGRFSPGQGSVGVGFEGRSRSVSPLRRKVPHDERPASPSDRSIGSNDKPVATGRFTSPSSLPVVEPGTADDGDGGGGGDVVEDTDCPERTTPLRPSGNKIDSPERTGEDTASDDGCPGGGRGVAGGKVAMEAPSRSFRKEEATRESAGGGPVGKVLSWLKIKGVDSETREGTLISPIETGAEGELLGPSARPSPLRPQLYSPFAQEPSPCTGNDHHLESFDAASEGGQPGASEFDREPPSSAPPVAAVATAAAEDSRPPLHGNSTGFRGHAPPGVRVVFEAAPSTSATAAAATCMAAISAGGTSSSTTTSKNGDGGKNREDFVGSSDGGRAAAAAVPPPPPPPRSSHGQGRTRGEPKLRVCTPTGDGGASDLSLWVTLRNLEEEENEDAAAAAAAGGGRAGGSRSFLSLSPVTTAGHAKDSVGGGRFSLSSAGGETASSGGAAKGGSAGVEERDDDEEKEEENEEDRQGEREGGDEAYSEAASLLASSNITADQGHRTSGGKGPGTGTAICSRIALPAATEKTEPAGGGCRSPAMDWCDVGPGPEVAGGGVGGLWRSLSRAICGLLNFCHPPQGLRRADGVVGGGDAGSWCR
eukprot:g6843.t1